MIENIVFSIICKDSDKFSEIESQLYELYPEYGGDNNFMYNGIEINKNNNLFENGINNKSIVYFKTNS